MTIQQHASFDSSAAELNATSKLVKAWESKNAKNAVKAGGISLMALSLAACGGSSTTAVVDVVDTTPVVDPAVTAAEAAQAAAEAAQAVAEAAQAAAEAELAAVNAPKSFTTTTAADSFVGNSGDDTFTATTANMANTDNFNGGDGSDVANLTLTGSTADAAMARMSAIEVVNIDYDGFATPTIDVSNIAGSAAINLSSTKVGYLGAATISDAGDHTVTAGAGMAGTLTVNGGETVTVNGTSATAIVVDGHATASKALSATVNAGTATTSVTVGTTNAFKSATIDAGEATAISVADQGTTSSSTVTVGKTNTFTNTTTGDLTLNVDAASVITTMSAIGKSLTVTGAQATTLKAASANLTAETVTDSLTAGDLTVTINGAIGADADLSKVAADSFGIATAFGGDFAVAVATGSTIDATVDLGNGEFGVLAANDGTADTLTINSTKNQAVIQVDGADATLGDIETTTINANAAAVTGTDMTITAITAGANKVVIAGTNDVVVTGATAKTLDASGLTGNFTLTDQTGTAALTVLGSTGTNSVTFNATANDSAFTGQDGNDTAAFDNTAGNITAIMGNGTNTVTANASTTGSLVVFGGTGVDTVTATTAGTGAGQVNLQLGAGNDVASITTSGANDNVNISGGAGNDALTLAGASTANDVITVDGGDGDDTLNISTDLTAGTLTFTSIETIAIGSSDSAAIVEASDVSGLSFTASGDGTATDHFFIDADAAGTYDFSAIVINNTLTKGMAGLDVTGHSGNDVITTGSGKDVIASGGGNDTITAGLGADSITGGGGIDTIVIGTADTGSTVATADDVTSFTSGTDKLSVGTAGTAANYTEIAGVNGDNLAATVVDVDAAMNGTVKFVYVYALDVLFATGGADAADGALFIDNDMDGSYDDLIVFNGQNLASEFAYTDVIA